MPDTEGAHIARLEERVRGVREDVASIVEEQGRMRKRLHDLEGIAGAFVDMQKQNRAAEVRQYRRLEQRIQILSVVIAVAAICVPLVVAILHTG